MKKRIPIFLLITASFSLASQEKIDLYSLFSQAQKNHPLHKQNELYQKQSDLNKIALKKNFYPQLNLNGQFTYQSDVTSIDIPVPGISLPEISKDQYRLNLDASQLIYDGGINQLQQKLVELKSHTSQTGTDTELYKLYGQVNNSFFTILLIEENNKAIEASLDELSKRIDAAKVAVVNGAMTRNDLDKLQAAKLQMAEKQIELKYQRISLINTLSELTGQHLSEETELAYPDVSALVTGTYSRPEHRLFKNQQVINQEQIELQGKTRMPKVFAFGQAGYGRPGYNMFSENFDDYYLIGLKMSWNIYDWNQTKKRQEALSLEQDIINNKKAAFDLNLKIAYEQQQSELEKFNALIENELKIIQMQKEILKRTSAELDNGTITTVDYISDLNNYTQAKIRMSGYEIQKLQAQVTLQIITGEIQSVFSNQQSKQLK